MKRVIAVSILAFLLLGAAPAKNIANVPIGVEVLIEPSSRSPYQLLRRPTPETYTCNALIFDASEDNYAFASPRVIVAAGERRSETVTVDGADVTFTVAISRTHDRAATEVLVKKNGETLFRQKSNVMLMAGTRR